MTGNIMFIIDIILMMNTTYYNRDGDEILNKVMIRKNYI